MKRFCLTVLFAAAVFTLYAQNGIIRELTGEVELKLAGTSDFVIARVGSEVARDTIVSTGFKSTAIITAGSTEIVVRPLTRLSLAEISSSAGTENLNVNLQAGRVRVDVKPPAGTRANTTVQSPSATASVRGTSFNMDTQNLTVTSGSVNWSDSKGFSAAVTVGFSSSIGGTGGIVDPIEIAAAELAPSAPVGSGDAGETAGASAVGEPVSGDINVDVDW